LGSYGSRASSTVSGAGASFGDHSYGADVCGGETGVAACSAPRPSAALQGTAPPKARAGGALTALTALTALAAWTRGAEECVAKQKKKRINVCFLGGVCARIVSSVPAYVEVH